MSTDTPNLGTSSDVTPGARGFIGGGGPILVLDTLSC